MPEHAKYFAVAGQMIGLAGPVPSALAAAMIRTALLHSKSIHDLISAYVLAESLPDDADPKWDAFARLRIAALEFEKHYLSRRRSEEGEILPAINAPPSIRLFLKTAGQANGELVAWANAQSERFDANQKVESLPARVATFFESWTDKLEAALVDSNRAGSSSNAIDEKNPMQSGLPQATPLRDVRQDNLETLDPLQIAETLQIWTRACINVWLPETSSPDSPARIFMGPRELTQFSWDLKRNLSILHDKFATAESLLRVRHKINVPPLPDFPSEVGGAVFKSTQNKLLAWVIDLEGQLSALNPNGETNETSPAEPVRHPEFAAEDSATSDPDPPVVRGKCGLRFDDKERSVKREGILESIDFGGAKKPYLIFKELATTRHRHLSFADLRRDVWDDDTGVEESAIISQISILNRKIGALNLRAKNTKSIGYQLVEINAEKKSVV